MVDNQIEIKRGGGYVGAFGSRIDNIAKQWSAPVQIATPTTSPFHITLLTKDELRYLSSNTSMNIDEVIDDASRIETRHIYSLGLGGDPYSVCWIVIVWNAGNIFRKKLGLPHKQFHITLTGIDDHSIDKGPNSLLNRLSIEESDVNLLDHLILSCQISDQYEQAFSYARETCQYHPQSEKGWVRLGDLARRSEQNKLSMLTYARAMQQSEGQGQDKIQEYCSKKIVHLALNHVEWGCLFGENEYEQIPVELRTFLLTPWPENLRNYLRNQFGQDQQPQRSQVSRIHMLVPYHRRPNENGEPGMFLLENI